jgi:hypothetical protein
MEREPQPTVGESLSTVPSIEPEPSCEKEVPYFIEEFTLSGGCCSGGE